MQTLNWVYGALAPTTNLELVEQQFVEAHRYRNMRIQLERERRAAYHALLAGQYAPYDEAIAAAEANQALIDSVYAEARARSQRARTKQPLTAEEKQIIRRAKNQSTQLWRAVATQRNHVKSLPQIVDQLNALKIQHRDAQKAAYNASPLYWCTKISIDDDLRDIGSGTPPRFRRFDRNGYLAVQLMLPYLPGEAFENGTPHAKASMLQLHGDNVSFRIGSVTPRVPIWATIPVIRHRPLPEGAMITWAYLHRKVVGPDVTWSLRLVINAPPTVRLASPGVPFQPLVAGHFGWRKLPNGDIRAATFRDSNGHTESLTFSAHEVAGFHIPKGLQKVRARRFNRAILRLSQWIDLHGNVPEWLAEARQHMRMWAAADRLHNLLLHWRENRFDGDEQVFRILHGLQHVPQRGWRKRDKHLWQWQERQRQKLINRRNDRYRKVAHSLAQRYARIVMPSVTWASLLTKADPVDDNATEQTANQLQQHKQAAPATLQQYLCEAFGRDCVVTVAAQDITRQCNACGSIEGDVESKLRHQCSNCGTTWDVDDNAARNQIARGLVELETLPPLDVVMSQRLTAAPPNRRRRR